MNIQDLSDAERAKLATLHDLYNKHDPVAVDVFYQWRSGREQLLLCACGNMIGTHELKRGDYQGDPGYVWEETVRFSFVATVYQASPEWVRKIIRAKVGSGMVVGSGDKYNRADPEWLLSVLDRPDLCEYIIKSDRFAGFPNSPTVAQVEQLEKDGIIKSIKAG